MFKIIQNYISFTPRSQNFILSLSSGIFSHHFSEKPYKTVYNRFNALVTKHMSPIGKNKPTSSARGVVVITILMSSLFEPERYGAMAPKYLAEGFLAFTSHLDLGVVYTLSVMGRKNGLNITIGHSSKPLEQEFIKKNFLNIYKKIKDAILKFNKSDLKRYGKRCYPMEIIKIIFSPLDNTPSDEPLAENLINSKSQDCNTSSSEDTNTSSSEDTNPSEKNLQKNTNFPPENIKPSSSEDTNPSEKNLQKNTNSPSENIKSSSSENTDTSFNFNKKETFRKENKGKQVNFFISGKNIERFNHNFFKEEFLKRYKSHLHNVLKNDQIVCVMIKVVTSIERGDAVITEYISLGTQFGYKFDYDELINWDYSKSIYCEIMRKFWEYKVIPSEYLREDFTFSSHTAPLNLDQFYTRLIYLLAKFLAEYARGDPRYIIITFTEIHSLTNSDKPVKNINHIPLKKNISNTRIIRKSFNESVLPLTLDENFYGKRSYSTKREYVDEKNGVKRIVYDNSSIKKSIEVYSLSSGELIDSFIDTKLDERSFIRSNTRSKTSLTIIDNKVNKMSQGIPLPGITFTPKKKERANSFNKHIGTFDLETYSNKGTIEVYAAGFAYGGNNVMISKPDIKTYYLERGLASEDVVLNCINEMLSSKYKKCIFYTHNLGGYDVIFLLKILGEYNNKVGEEYYKIKAGLKDNKILKLQISVKKSKSVTNTIYLVDSLALLPTSLSSLSKAFKTEYEKPLFPYTFVTEKTLYYVGVTPSIDFYNTIKEDISLDEYKKLYKDKWNIQEETLIYLESDLISLLQIMYEFSSHIFNNYQIQITECLTITGLAMDIFLNNFYGLTKNGELPLIKNKSIYNDLKESYYGGLSEVYRGYGENLFYYDVNSLYPYAALNDMPGKICEYIESHSDEGLNITKDKLFGFFYCDVKTNSDYFGLLPYRMNGLLTYPTGEFSGWFFSPLIEFALSRGYKINVKKGYNFNRVSGVFEDFVETIYKEKQKAKGAWRLITKFLLNSLLGRFGMHIDKRTTSLINDHEKYLDIITKYEVFWNIKISENLFLLTHSNEPNEAVCEQHGIDYIDVLNNVKGLKINVEDSTSIKNVSVGVSSAVTAYSSIFMSKIKELILASGGNIYYTDTDSIVTDKKLPEEYIGTKLGAFKLEYEIIRGYFISSKLYCLIVWDQKNNCELTIIKGKGIQGTKLSEDDFIKMLNNETISNAVKSHSNKNYTEGYVKLELKENIHLNPSNYRKRIKIIDEISGKWINTKPLIIGKKDEK